MTDLTHGCEACGHRSHTGAECVAGIFTVCGCDADYPNVKERDDRSQPPPDDAPQRAAGGTP